LLKLSHLSGNGVAMENLNDIFSEPVILGVIGAIVTIYSVTMSTWSQIKKYEVEKSEEEREKKKNELSRNDEKTQPILYPGSQESINDIAAAAASLVKTAQEQLDKTTEERQAFERIMSRRDEQYDIKLKKILHEFSKVVKGVTILTKQLKKMEIEPEYVPDVKAIQELSIQIDEDIFQNK
jgi:biopolymer transport protein ExbB/TolQ